MDAPVSPRIAAVYQDHPVRIFRDIAVNLAGAERLRATGLETDAHIAARLDLVAGDLLQVALDQGLEQDMFQEDLPEADGSIGGTGAPSDVTGNDGGDGPGGSTTGPDYELAQELQSLEDPATSGQQPPPTGLPTEDSINQPLAISVPQQPSLHGAAKGAEKVAGKPRGVVPTADNIGPQEDDPPRRRPKLGRRNYIACGEPTLVRASGGRVVWMSVCAYQQPPSKRTRITAKVVGTNRSFKPRDLAVATGKKIRFVTEAEVMKLVDSE